jgi:hypothetical protein
LTIRRILLVAASALAGLILVAEGARRGGVPVRDVPA